MRVIQHALRLTFIASSRVLASARLKAGAGEGLPKGIAAAKADGVGGEGGGGGRLGVPTGLRSAMLAAKPGREANRAGAPPMAGSRLSAGCMPARGETGGSGAGRPGDGGAVGEKTDAPGASGLAGSACAFITCRRQEEGRVLG